MESYFLQYSGGRGDGGFNSSLCAGVTLSTARSSAAAAPTTLFQCWDCFQLFTSEAALIQHQLQKCSFAAKAMGFLERLRQAQQVRISPSLPKRPYYDDDNHHQFKDETQEPSHFLFVDTEEGSGTDDPFDDDNNTLDLVSRMDHDFVGTNFGYAGNVGARDSAAAGASNGDEEELDLELKL